MKLNEELVTAVKEVNMTLKKYEPHLIYAKRLPYLEEERCEFFRQWIEVRLNFEIFDNVPELTLFEEMFSGELFIVTAVIDEDATKRRFKEVHVSITNSPNSYLGDGNYLDELEKVKQILGGSSFTFNYSCKKTKVNIL